MGSWLNRPERLLFMNYPAVSGVSKEYRFFNTQQAEGYWTWGCAFTKEINMKRFICALIFSIGFSVLSLSQVFAEEKWTQVPSNTSDSQLTALFQTAVDDYLKANNGVRDITQEI